MNQKESQNESFIFKNVFRLLSVSGEKWLSSIALFTVAATLSVLASESANYAASSINKWSRQSKNVVPITLNERMMAEIIALKKDVLEIKNNQMKIPSSKGAKINDVVKEIIYKKLDDIENKQKSIEDVILNNPEKALTIPLMQRDINNIKETNIQNFTSIKQSIDQIYDLTKWLLGALSVGVLSLAIANFVPKAFEKK